MESKKMGDTLTKAVVFGLVLAGNATILGMALLSCLYSYFAYGFVDASKLYNPYKLVWVDNIHIK